MSPFSLFVSYLLIWWMTLFIVLPLGVRGQAEAGQVVEGSEPGAPVDSNCLLYTSPSPRDKSQSRMPSSA